MSDGKAETRDAGQFLRSLTYVATVALGQGMSFLLLPFVTRALEPEAYGEYALALAVSSLVGVIASSWIRNVTLRVYFDAVERGTSRGLYLGTALLQAVTFAAVYLVALAGMAAFGLELATIRVMVSAGVMVAVGDLTVHTLILLRAERRARAFAIGEIGAGASRFALTLGGLAIGLRDAQLLFDAATLGYLIACAYVVPVLWRRLSGPMRVDVPGTVEVIRHGPRSLPFSVADWLERLADRVILGFLLGTSVVGVYSVGYAVGERTLGVVVRAVFMMAWPDVLAAWKEGGRAAARKALRYAQELYAWFSVGPLLFMVAYGGEFLRVFAGPAYHEATSLVGIVAVSMWIGGFTSYQNRHLELTKRYGTFSGVVMVGAVVNVVLNFVLIPWFGMAGAAWATMANRVLNVAVFWVIRDRELVSVPWASYALAASWATVAWGVSGIVDLGPIASMVTFVALYAPVALLRMRTLRAR